MATLMNIYTMGIMEDAVIDDVSSEATGHPAENLLNYEPDTYWSPATSGVEYVIIDLGSAQTVDAAAVFFNNYLTDHSNSDAAYIRIQHSDNGTSFTTNTDIDIPASLGGPILLHDITSGSHRYWSFGLVDTNTTVKFGGAYLLRKRAIGQGNEYPENDANRFFNLAVESRDGRTRRQRLTKSHSIKFGRSWFFCGDTDWTSLPLYLAHTESFGSFMPVIVQEGSATGICRLAHFLEDELPKNEFDYRCYNPSVTFETVPYIQDGESY